jgi:hypothetical protein
MPILVAMRVDDGVTLLEMIRTFPTDTISMLWEGPNTAIGRFRWSFVDELEDSCLGHGGILIKLMFVCESMSEEMER